MGLHASLYPTAPFLYNVWPIIPLRFLPPVFILFLKKLKKEKTTFTQL